jgi:hypothetical protein
LIPSIPVNVTYAANKASDVNAAEAIANPFPVAAVYSLQNLKYQF